MELENSQMYTLSIKDLNGNDITEVTDLGMNLKYQYPHLVVGQVVQDWKMYVVTPFC